MTIDRIDEDGGFEEMAAALPEERDVPFLVGDLVQVLPHGVRAKVAGLTDRVVEIETVHAQTGALVTTHVAPEFLRLMLRRADPGAEDRLRILSYEDLRNLPPPRWLIHRFIRCGEVGEIHGEPNCGKSFIALSLSLSVCTGAEWFGRRVKQGDVLYIAAEGVHGFERRVRAWAGDEFSTHFEAFRRSFFLIGDAVKLLQGDGDVLLKQIREVGQSFSLIVIDTLARCFIGGDENSAEDMSVFIDACDLIRKETGAAVLLVHHTAKGSDRERGSSALRGAADAMFQVVRDKDTRDIVMTCDKQKEGPTGDTWRFLLDSIWLGEQDEDGPVTSCRLVRRDPPAEEAQEGQGAGQQGGLDAGVEAILEAAAQTALEPGASASQLRDLCGLTKPTFYRKLKLAKEYFDVFGTEHRPRYRLNAAANALGHSHYHLGLNRSHDIDETKGPEWSQQSQSHVHPFRGGLSETETETDAAGEEEGLRTREGMLEQEQPSPAPTNGGVA